MAGQFQPAEEAAIGAEARQQKEVHDGAKVMNRGAAGSALSKSGVIVPHPIAMNRLLPLFTIALATQASAQLINGSFEQNGVQNFMGWEWTCEDPLAWNEAPAGAGQWSVSKESGHAKGCFPNHLFQRLSGVQDGDLLTISGWVRCDDDVICLGAYFGLGTINNGTFQLEENVGTNQFPWTYLTITDTVELAAGDTSILVLNAGFIGGPINPNPGHFDGFAVAPALSIDVAARTSAHIRQDAGMLYVSCGEERLLATNVMDLTGRNVGADIVRTGPSSCQFSTSHLPTGTYFVSVRTPTGERASRFAVQ